MKKFGVNDIKVLMVIVAIGLLLVMIYVFYPRKAASSVDVLMDGKCVGTYDLRVDASIPIEVNGTVTNTLEICDGKAFMSDATCPDKLCMKQGKISHQGETIVCLPNKIVIQVNSDDMSEFDSVAK